MPLIFKKQKQINYKLKINVSSVLKLTLTVQMSLIKNDISSFLTCCIHPRSWTRSLVGHMAKAQLGS